MQATRSIALRLLIGITLFALLLHVLILIKLIPYAITWGGRLQNDREMYLFESLSIIILLFFLLVLLQKGRLLKAILSEKALTIILWFYFGLFALNTIGNVFAETRFEQSFTVVTGSCALLLWIINRKPNNEQS